MTDFTRAIALIVALSLVAASASAQPARSEEADRQEAIEHFKKGNALFKQRAWAAALAELLESRRLSPTKNATRNAAVCLRELGRYDEALDLFEALLRESDALPDDLRTEAQQEIERLGALVGALVFEGLVPGAAITVDGRGRGDVPARAPLPPLRVSAGSHLVRVYKEGYQPFETRVEVAGGRTVGVVARLRPLQQSGLLRVVERAGRALDLLVDGNVVGQTPWEGPLSPEDHTILLRGKAGLGTLPMRVKVRFKELTTIELSADYLRASVRIQPTPGDAVVSVDGVVIGPGTWEGNLGTGVHQIEVSAPGYLSEKRQVPLESGDHESVAIVLRPDPDAASLRSRARWVFEIDGALPVVPRIGGVASTCTGRCVESPGLGAFVVARAGRELESRIGFGGTLGFLQLGQTVLGRAAEIHPVGLPPSPGSADDRLALRALVAGAWTSVTRGQATQVRVRFGAGAVIGSLAHTREGTFRSADGRSYAVGPVGDAHLAAFAFIDPEVRLGFPLSQGLSLTVGVEGFLLISLARPTWDHAHLVGAKRDGIATFPAENLISPILFVLAPGIGLRYER